MNKKLIKRVHLPKKAKEVIKKMKMQQVLQCNNFASGVRERERILQNELTDCSVSVG